MAELVHIMMDLETLGTVPGCAAFSIGCVVMDFEAGELKEQFYTLISIPDCLENFLEEDEETKEWWDRKPPEARAALIEAAEATAPRLAAALEDLNAWFASIGATVKTARLYGNGADFDNPILRVMQRVAKVLPFGSKAGFFGGRCYRTLKSLHELFGPAFVAPKLVREGTFHNALDDAKSQGRHLIEIVRAVRAATQKENTDG